jgi:signal transduction histidine kinase
MAMVHNSVSVGYNLAVGLAPLHHPLLAWNVQAWMAITGQAFLVAVTCVPLLMYLRRFDVMRRTGLPSWSVFFAVITTTCVLGGISRVLTARAIGLDLPAQVLSLDLAVFVGLNMTLMVAVSELYGRHLERQTSDARRRKRFAAELMQTEQVMANAEDRWRQELAEFVHGPLQSHLFLAWVRLKEAQGSPAERARALEEASQLLNLVRTDDLRRVRSDLSDRAPTEAFDAGLDRLTSRFGLAVSVVRRWSPEALECARSLAPAVRTVLLQLLEEAMLNALRHGAPSRIELHATLRAGAMRIAVKDDGKGFRQRQAPSGLGLRTLGRKLEVHGGTLDVQSSLGWGTEVIATLPLTPEGP